MQLHRLQSPTNQQIDNLYRATRLLGEDHVEPRHLPLRLRNDFLAARTELVIGGPNDDQQYNGRDKPKGSTDRSKLSKRRPSGQPSP